VRPDTPTEVNGWVYPGIGQLLSTSSETADEAEQREWLTRLATATKSALQQIQLQAKLLDSALTPNSALLKFAGSANMTVDQVLRRRSELLTTFGLNVISVRPEPGAVVVAVERPEREVVNVQELWSRWRPGTAEWGNQHILIGVRENDGSQLFLSPGRKHAPHTLIAGSTGSGKSVLMQNIILGIAATNTPEQARILLIDPKQGVDYFAFEDLPHLDGGIIDDQETASRRLSELVVEMDRRYVRFKQVRVPNLAAYNAKVAADQRLPAIWLIHDEFAEWMLVEDYKESVASVVQRLGVKARAAGIYLVFAAQRPDALVMPMQLRANLGNRLILRVDSEGTSEIALGDKGAERLLGKGHLLAKLEGERELCFAQVPFVDPDFATAVVAAVCGEQK
jgi:S-DNA-T family DNA segregation ATPase FtsK/SpoIIIE